MKVYTIGGVSEVGRNMTVIETGEDAFIFDCGLHIPAIIEIQENERINKLGLSEKILRNKGAVPDDLILDKLNIRHKVRGILLSHAHLDHVGAVPYIAYRYNAPVVGTPFTISVLKKIMSDDKKGTPNKLISVNVNSSITIKGKSGSYRIEFINMTHSTPHSTMIALHTPEGIALYGNDFKLDNTPVIGNPPNYQALKKISKEGIKVAILDSLYSGHAMKTPSEKVARSMVEEVLLTVRNENSAIFVSTFSSHIARLKSIVEYAKKLNREVLFVGRSLNKYISAGVDVNLVPFRKDIKLISYRNQMQSAFRNVSKNPEKYLVVCTGHQAEPGSILDRLSRKQFPFEFKKGDNLIFSSKTIPVPINIENRENMDKRFRKTGVRIFDNIHVSGHGGREDLRDLISLISPEHIIPSHGSTEQISPLIELTSELGYKKDKQVHLMRNGQKLEL